MYVRYVPCNVSLRACQPGRILGAEASDDDNNSNSNIPYVCMYVCVSLSLYLSIYLSLSLHIYIYMYVYIYIYIYIGRERERERDAALARTTRLRASPRVWRLVAAPEPFIGFLNIITHSSYRTAAM